MLHHSRSTVARHHHAKQLIVFQYQHRHSLVPHIEEICRQIRISGSARQCRGALCQKILSLLPGIVVHFIAQLPPSAVGLVLVHFGEVLGAAQSAIAQTRRINIGCIVRLGFGIIHFVSKILALQKHVFEYDMKYAMLGFHEKERERESVDNKDN
jgi:hypothetical protein